MLSLKCSLVVNKENNNVHIIAYITTDAPLSQLRLNVYAHVLIMHMVNALCSKSVFRVSLSSSLIHLQSHANFTSVSINWTSAILVFSDIHRTYLLHFHPHASHVECLKSGQLQECWICCWRISCHLQNIRSYRVCSQYRNLQNGRDRS